ncbi:MAG: hypothetical protein AAGC44_05470 [Planctomycetota bacterium]
MNDHIQRLERIQEFVGAYEQLRKDDPVAASCALLIIGREVVPAAQKELAQEDHAGPLWGDTHYERIQKLFCERQNKWLSVSDIRLATDIGRGATAQILYTTHSESFDKKPHPHHASMKLWRLNERAYKEALNRFNEVLSETAEASKHQTRKEPSMV